MREVFYFLFGLKIYLCHKLKLSKQFPENVVQKYAITEFGENWVAFTDGSKEEIDTILHCTGTV